MAGRKSILIVDDDEMSRELLRQMFEDEYNVIFAKDGKEAIAQIGTHIKDIAVILLDIVMPVLNGYQVLQVLNAKKIVDRIPVVLITAQKDTKVELSCYALGASAVISKPYVAQVVRTHVHNIIEMYSKTEKLEGMVEKYKGELSGQQQKTEIFKENLIDVLSNIIEFRNVECETHIKRVKGMTGILAQTYMQMFPESGLTRKKIGMIVKAAGIHDIGKITVPDSILLKPSSLKDGEMEVIKSHTTKGCEILGMLEDVRAQEQYKISYEVCRSHHERYDGNGYPDGLTGEDIPLSAQLVSIADAYESLLSERVYRKAYDKQTSYNMIINEKCGVFSPKLIQCFEACRTALEEYSDNI